MSEIENNGESWSAALEARLLARLSSPLGVSAHASPGLAAADRLESLLSGLPGLASLSGGFGSTAFDISTFLATESRFSYALSPDLRVMNIAELSELVQVVLEEEEAALEAFEAEVSQRRGRRAPKKAAAAPKAPGQERKLREVRRAIQRIRAEAAAKRADIARRASARTGPSGLEGVERGVKASPSLQVETFHPDDLQASGSIKESIAILRHEVTSEDSAPGGWGDGAQFMDRHGDIPVVSPLTLMGHAAHDRTLTRALRLAEASADRALLTPQLDAADTFYRGERADLQGHEGARMAARTLSSRSVSDRAGRTQLAQAQREALLSRGGATLTARAAGLPSTAATRLPDVVRQRLAVNSRPIAAAGEAGPLPVELGLGADLAPNAPQQADRRRTMGAAGAAPISALAAAVQGSYIAQKSAERWRGGEGHTPPAPALAVSAERLPTGVLAPALERWLASTDALLDGRPESGATSALADQRVARVSRVRELDSVGGGEMLALYESVGGLGVGERDEGAAAGLPSWLTGGQATVSAAAAAAGRRQRLDAIEQSAGAGGVVAQGTAPRDSFSDAITSAGGVAVATLAMTRGVERRVGPLGVTPVVEPSWRSTTTRAASSPSSTMALPGDALPAIGSVAELERISAVTGIPLDSLSRLNPEAVATMRGALVADAGPGEWLLPGDPGFDSYNEGQRDGVATARPATKPPRGSSLAAAVRSDAGRASPMTRAADAALAHVVDRVAKVHALSAAAPQATQAPGSIVEFARDHGAWLASDLLGLTPNGVADSVTPWALARQVVDGRVTTPRDVSWAMDAPTTWLDLGADEFLPERGGAESTTRQGRLQTTASPSATPSDGPAQVGASRASLLDTTGLSASERRSLSRLIGGGAKGGAPGSSTVLAQLGSPAAVKAALAMFGERADTGQGPDQAFVDRFFGFVRRDHRAAESGGMTMLSPSLAAQAASTTSVVDGGDGAIAASDTGEQVVFKGVAGLAALREMAGAGRDPTTLLDLGEVEGRDASGASAPGTGASGLTAASATAEQRTDANGVGLSQPTTAARAPGAMRESRTAQGGGRGALTRSSRRTASIAARTHRFAPPSLRRSRRLLNVAGEASALRATPRGRVAAGYGDSSLGGGALLGLMPGDRGAPGETFGHTATGHRAERIGAAIEARRAPRPGQVLRPVPAGTTPRETVQRSSSAAGAAPYSASAAAGLSEAPLLQNNAATANAMAAAASVGQSAAPAQARQAGAMARVLSVTSAPSANVLPLVAPAARAVVAHAAAKPVAESIATSGANATTALPLTGHDVSGGGGDTKGGSGGGSGATEEAGGGPAQDVNKLAMKIARSVMVRIKRERERRGIHG